MADTLKTVHVDPGSELGKLLDEATETDILLEKDGMHYRLNRVQTSSGPESERVLNIIGLGESESDSDIARDKDHHIADAIDHHGA